MIYLRIWIEMFFSGVKIYKKININKHGNVNKSFMELQKKNP
jgi:hypothetical protein